MNRGTSILGGILIGSLAVSEASNLFTRTGDPSEYAGLDTATAEACLKMLGADAADRTAMDHCAAIVHSANLTVSAIDLPPNDGGPKTPTPGPTKPGPALPPVKTPTPVNPTPVNPPPVNPTPVNPSPVSPTPVNPKPDNPTPVNPTPVNPAPVNPSPVNPTPVNPSPVAPPPAKTTPESTPSGTSTPPEKTIPVAPSPAGLLCRNTGGSYPTPMIKADGTCDWSCYTRSMKSNGLTDAQIAQEEKILSFNYNYRLWQAVPGTPLDVPVTRWGWDPYKTILQRQQYGYKSTWDGRDPNAPKAWMAPGLSAPGDLPAYEPPAGKSIPVTLTGPWDNAPGACR